MLKHGRLLTAAHSKTHSRCAFHRQHVQTLTFVLTRAFVPVYMHEWLAVRVSRQRSNGFRRADRRRGTVADNETINLTILLCRPWPCGYVPRSKARNNVDARQNADADGIVRVRARAYWLISGSGRPRWKASAGRAGWILSPRQLRGPFLPLTASAELSPARPPPAVAASAPTRRRATRTNQAE